MSESTASTGRATGRRLRRGSGTPPIWFGIPFVLLGTVAFIASLFGVGNEMRLSNEGLTVAGHVTATRIDHGTGDDPDTYRVSYAFVDAATAREYAGSTTVGQRAYASIRIGDPITVTYLPSDPRTNRPGTAELDLLPALLGIGVGLLFAVVGVGLIVMSWRARGRARLAAAAGVVEAPLTGLVSAIPTPTATTSAELRRVDRFTRSFGRAVIEPFFFPIGGVGFLGLAVWMLTQIASNPMFLLLFALPAFFGVMLLSGIPGALRRGFGRLMLEVGPDGLWHRDAGRFAWSEIAQLRIEHNRGAAGEEGTATYLRLGIVPRDAARSAGLARSLAWRLAGGFVRFANTLARWRGMRDQLTDIDAMAPIGIYGYEIEQPFEQVVASIGRYAPVADMAQAPLPAAEPEPSTREEPLTDTEIRAIDGHLGEPGAASVLEPGGGLLPEPIAPSLVAVEPARNQQPDHRREVFRRRGFTAGDAISLVMPGESTTLPPVAGVIGRAVFGVIFMVVPALIILSIVTSSLSRGDLVNALIPLGMGVVFVAAGWFSIRGTRRRWELATGDADLLTVDQDGLELRDGRRLRWDQIELVENTGSRLVIRPVGASPDEIISFDFDLFEDDDDDILDAIARYRVVEG